MTEQILNIIRCNRCNFRIHGPVLFDKNLGKVCGDCKKVLEFWEKEGFQ